MAAPERIPPQVSPRDRHRNFVRKVNRFPEEAQETVATASSMLLEPDVAARFRGNPTDIKAFIGQLTSNGLQPEQVDVVLDYFELANPNKETKE